jgi:hypothetical protein
MKKTMVSEIGALLVQQHMKAIGRKRPDWAKSQQGRGEQELVPALTAFDLAMGQVEANTELSFTGKGRAANRLRQDVRAKVEALRKEVVGKVMGNITQEESTLANRTAYQPSQDPAVRLREELAAQEIRAQVRGLDPLQRFLIYAQADSRDDKFTIYALESGPQVVDKHPRGHRDAGMPYLADIVDRDKVQQARLARLERNHPAEVEKLRDMRDLAGAWTAVLDGVLHAVGKDEDVPEVKAPPAPPQVDPRDPLAALLRAGLVPAVTEPAVEA